jgi:hypothetical protein
LLGLRGENVLGKEKKKKEKEKKRKKERKISSCIPLQA